MSVDIIAAARAYTGVRWHHQGRSRLGIDCVGLLICVGRDLGHAIPDFRDYHRNISSSKFVEILAQYTRCIPVSEASVGDILGFGAISSKKLHHCGFKSNMGIIHASYEQDGTGKVIEGSISEALMKRLHSAWRF